MPHSRRSGLDMRVLFSIAKQVAVVAVFVVVAVDVVVVVVAVVVVVD